MVHGAESVPSGHRRGRAAAAVALLLLGTLAAAGCGRRENGLSSVPTATVARKDIVVTVEATGTVEPINLVDVKSKASGQIVRMPVEIGSVVRQGDLLAQIDPRDVQSAYDQAKAALVAAQARVQVTKAARRRADTLAAAQVITEAEHETAVLDDATAQSQLVTARTNLDQAKVRLDDATVRAPVGGTILAKPVSVGQVISSATSSVSGGTSLLQMANLSRIRLRVLVSETDVGRVREGQDASVVVDAYPQRTFRGVVEKIEPQAVIQQSVTMFPVLVSISNERGLLLPGMNGEVTVLVDRRDSVLTIPVDAARSLREISSVAATLGIDVDSLRALMRASAGATSGAGRAPGDTSSARRRWRGPGGAGAGQGAWRGRGGGAGAGRPGAAGGFAGREAGLGGGGFGSPGGGRGMPQLVVVKTARGFEPRRVHLGLSNYDDAEVLDGLREGDQVVLLSVVDLQQQRSQTMERIRARVGSRMGVGSSSSGRSGSSRGGGR